MSDFNKIDKDKYFAEYIFYRLGQEFDKRLGGTGNLNVVTYDDLCKIRDFIPNADFIDIELKTSNSSELVAKKDDNSPHDGKARVALTYMWRYLKHKYPEKIDDIALICKDITSNAKTYFSNYGRDYYSDIVISGSLPVMGTDPNFRELNWFKNNTMGYLPMSVIEDYLNKNNIDRLDKHNSSSILQSLDLNNNIASRPYINSYSREELYNEYLYKEALDLLSESSKSNNNPAITTSAGRLLREKLDAVSNSKYNTSYGKLKSNQLDVIRDTFRENIELYNVFDVGTSIYDDFVLKLSDDAQIRDDFNSIINSKYLPLSPYAPDYAYHSVFLDNGSATLYTPINNYDVSVSDKDVKMKFTYKTRMYKMNNNGKYKYVGSGLQPGDLSGLSALKSFIKEEDWTKLTQLYDKNGKPVTYKNVYDIPSDVVAWVDDVPIVDGKRNYMSTASIKKARSVLSELQMQGYSFSLQRDNYMKGYVEAVFDNKMKLRVFCPGDEGLCCARIYNNNSSIYFQAYNDSSKYFSYTPTKEECLSLIYFSMGKHVKAWEYNDGKYGTYAKSNHIGDIFWKYENGKQINYINAYTNKELSRYSVGRRCLDADKKVESNVTIVVKYNDNIYNAIKYDLNNELSAQSYLTNAVKSATENFKKAVNLDEIIEGVKISRDNEDDYKPPFDDEDDVSVLQSSYWEFLSGQSNMLNSPEILLSQYESEFISNVFDEDIKHVSPDMPLEERIEMVKQHLEQSTLGIIGKFDYNEFDNTGDTKHIAFSPTKVVRYMDNDVGIMSARDFMVTAMRTIKYEPEYALQHDSSDNHFYLSHADLFDEENARNLLTVKDGRMAYNFDAENNPADKFLADMCKEVYYCVRLHGCSIQPDDVLIDPKGIIQYKAKRRNLANVNKDSENSYQDVLGYIGHVYASVDNVVKTPTHYFVPGYEATILPNAPGENLPYEYRLKLKGYEQSVIEGIQQTIHTNFSVPHAKNVQTLVLGDSGNIDRLYKHLYDTRYSLDFFERTEKDGMSNELRQAIIDTNAARVRIKEPIGGASDRASVYNTVNKSDFDERNDNNCNGVTLTGYRNVNIQEGPGDGIFDKYFTGNGSAQGVRYLVKGATVDYDGRIIPSDNPDDVAPMIDYMMKTGRVPDKDAADRMNMTANGLLHCLRETEPVGVAQITFGGFTFEDGIVVSKEFADKNQVRVAESDDEYRSLIIGDKMECHGNKGVISAIIDRNMTRDDALNMGLSEKQWQTLEPAVKWFKANPNLDIVMSPYSAVSRFNAGLGVEAINSVNSGDYAGKTNLVNPDTGEVLEDVVGHVTMTILEQTADDKTHFEEDRQRNYGAQLGWALIANEVPNVANECYGGNGRKLLDLNEYLNVCGMSVDTKGKLHKGIDLENRTMFEMQPLELKGIFSKEYKPKANVTSRTRKMTEDFLTKIDKYGGIAEYPFPIKFYDSDETFPLIPNDKRSDESKKNYEGNVYAMPVLSAGLRAGRSAADDTQKAVLHDYTHYYAKMNSIACDYRGDVERLSESDFEGRDALFKQYTNIAQELYNSFSKEIIDYKFTGKKNIFRAGILSAPQFHSATAIMTPDPGLSIDAIGMNPDMMEYIGVKDNDYVAIHRDPVLQGSGIRYMKVKSDARLTGISINPMGVVGELDGDFDGDTVGANKFSNEKANKEAIAKLSVRANLLNPSSYNSETDEFDLVIASGQDIAAGWAKNPDLKKRYEEIRTEVNNFERKYKELENSNGKLTAELRKERNTLRNKAVKDIDNYLTDCLSEGFGKHVISYKDEQSHIDSIKNYVNDGAKGSLSKVDMYEQFMTKPSRDAQISILKAKDMQVHYTGHAGSFTMRAMAGLSAVCPDAATRVNKCATQGVLQVKHDSIMADRYESMLTDACRNLWRGYKLEPSTKVYQDTVMAYDENDRWIGYNHITSEIPTWNIVYGDDNKPVQATKEEFKAQMKSVYCDHMHLDLSDKLLDEIAECMSDDKGNMLNLETDMIDTYGVPIYRLAYAKKDKEFETLRTVCDEMEKGVISGGMFELPDATKAKYGDKCKDMLLHFAGYETRKAIRDVKEEVKIVARKDVQREYFEKKEAEKNEKPVSLKVYNKSGGAYTTMSSYRKANKDNDIGLSM